MGHRRSSIRAGAAAIAIVRFGKPDAVLLDEMSCGGRGSGSWVCGAAELVREPLFPAEGSRRNRFEGQTACVPVITWGYIFGQSIGLKQPIEHDWQPDSVAIAIRTLRRGREVTKIIFKNNP
jgi:hypothetical protein